MKRFIILVITILICSIANARWIKEGDTIIYKSGKVRLVIENYSKMKVEGLGTSDVLMANYRFGKDYETSTLVRQSGNTIHLADSKVLFDRMLNSCSLGERCEIVLLNHRFKPAKTIRLRKINVNNL